MRGIGPGPREVRVEAMLGIHERRCHVEPEPSQARCPDRDEEGRFGFEPRSQIGEPPPHQRFPGYRFATHEVIIGRQPFHAGERQPDDQWSQNDT